MPNRMTDSDPTGQAPTGVGARRLWGNPSHSTTAVAAADQHRELPFANAHRRPRPLRRIVCRFGQSDGTTVGGHLLERMSARRQVTLIQPLVYLGKRGGAGNGLALIGHDWS